MRRAMMHHANRSRALGVVSLAGAVTLLAACATQPGEPGAGQPLTPTSRYVLQVEPGVDRIALAVRPDGVSHNQNAALSDLTHRFAMSGAPRVVVEAPGGNDPAAAAFAWAARDAVAALGVPMDRIVVAAYAAPDPRAPVLVGFETLRAHVPQCAGRIGDLARNASNEPDTGFGCAVTANMAAQIANPRDIVIPRDMTAPDAPRRATVLDAYRIGEVTSAELEPLVEGRISEAVE